MNHVENHDYYEGMKPFTCKEPGCVKRYTCKYNLHRHMKCCHNKDQSGNQVVARQPPLPPPPSSPSPSLRVGSWVPVAAAPAATVAMETKVVATQPPLPPPVSWVSVAASQAAAAAAAIAAQNESLLICQNEKIARPSRSLPLTDVCRYVMEAFAKADSCSASDITDIAVTPPAEKPSRTLVASSNSHLSPPSVATPTPTDIVSVASVSDATFAAAPIQPGVTPGPAIAKQFATLDERSEYGQIMHGTHSRKAELILRYLFKNHPDSAVKVIKEELPLDDFLTSVGAGDNISWIMQKFWPIIKHKFSECQYIDLRNRCRSLGST